MPGTTAMASLGWADPLKPEVGLLAKLGSIAVHVEEYVDELAAGNLVAAQFDADALRALRFDPEVREWLDGMRRMALLPVRRTEM